MNTKRNDFSYNIWCKGFNRISNRQFNKGFFYCSIKDKNLNHNSCKGCKQFEKSDVLKVMQKIIKGDKK